MRRFRREGWVFPRRIRRGIGKGEVHWGELNTSRVLQILHNPRYAGAFVYGRTRTARKADLTNTQLKVAQGDWQVLIRDAHVGYIDWEEFERNQLALKQSATEGTAGVTPASANVYHLHPIGLVGNFIDPDACACGCCVTVTGTRFKKDAHTYWYGPQHSGSILLGNCPALTTMRANGTLSETEEKILRAMSQNEGKWIRFRRST